MNAPESREEIYKSYGFSYLDFIGLSGKYDVYSVGEISERDQSISALRTQVQELSEKLLACDERLEKLKRHWGVQFLSIFQKDLLPPR
jgi:hypothetical protein